MLTLNLSWASLTRLSRSVARRIRDAMQDFEANMAKTRYFRRLVFCMSIMFSTLIIAFEGQAQEDLSFLQEEPESMSVNDRDRLRKFLIKTGEDLVSNNSRRKIDALHILICERARALSEIDHKNGRTEDAVSLLILCMRIWDDLRGKVFPDVEVQLGTIFNRGRMPELQQRLLEAIANRLKRDRINRIDPNRIRSLIQSNWYFKEDPAASFRSAQFAIYGTSSAAIERMALRATQGSEPLAQSIRVHQDALAEWRAIYRELTENGYEFTPQSSETTSNNLLDQLMLVEAQVSSSDRVIRSLAPRYFEYSVFRPSSVEDIKRSLRDDEALVLLLDADASSAHMPEETFVWVVTKNDVRWARSELGTLSLQREVAALRCGLDYTEWLRSEGSHCKNLTSVQYTVADSSAGKPPPFDIDRAHALYNSLFSGVEDLFSGKHLLIVPSGPLTQLPFQVLVAAKPSPKAETAWLARSNAITVLPSVSSLTALRKNAKASAAKEPFVGFGNPELTSKLSCGKVFVPDKCPDNEGIFAGAQAPLTRSKSPTGQVTGFYRNGLADLEKLRELCPLPETAFELNCVAKSLGASSSSIMVGKDMTETALKKASLSRYRVIHFATHGLLASETATLANSLAEPALVMSPPVTATEEDDGLLTASEIAGLKLDADWVVMSACNTAGGGASETEALSGLARAFFYAGARALLVSHWPVNSYAATMLTSRTFAEMRKDSTWIGGFGLVLTLWRRRRGAGHQQRKPRKLRTSRGSIAPAPAPRQWRCQTGASLA